MIQPELVFFRWEVVYARVTCTAALHYLPPGVAPASSILVLSQVLREGEGEELNRRGNGMRTTQQV
jgi:hypothetical protein